MNHPLQISAPTGTVANGGYPGLGLARHEGLAHGAQAIGHGQAGDQLLEGAASTITEVRAPDTPGPTCTRPEQLLDAVGDQGVQIKR